MRPAPGDGKCRIRGGQSAAPSPGSSSRGIRALLPAEPCPRPILPFVQPKPTADLADRRLMRTLRVETVRAVLLRPSFVAAQGGGLLFLVARDHFQASPFARALVAGAFFIGLLLSPWALQLAARSRLPAERALALAALGSAAGLLVAALSQRAGAYLAGVLIGIPLSSAATPLITAIWQARVPSGGRGRRYARVTSMAGLGGVLAALAWVALLGRTVDGFRPVLLIIALAMIGSAAAAWRLPTTPIGSAPGPSLGVLSLLWREPRFGLINLGWSLLGFGNLATMPLRTEYLRGAGGIDFGYGAQEVLLLVTVVPHAVALLAALVWGRLFDRFGFYGLRVSLNGCFVLSLALFFTPWWWAQLAGAVALGLGQGGEQVVWGLWVTDFAPPERTADYMAVHTFLTGLRGIAGPLAAYALLQVLPLVGVAYGGLALVLVSILLFGWIARRAVAERETALPASAGG